MQPLRDDGNAMQSALTMPNPRRTAARPWPDPAAEGR